MTKEIKWRLKVISKYTKCFGEVNPVHFVLSEHKKISPYTSTATSSIESHFTS